MVREIKTMRRVKGGRRVTLALKEWSDRLANKPLGEVPKSVSHKELLEIAEKAKASGMRVQKLPPGKAKNK